MLQPDTIDKGIHAVHVHRHRKMKRHCTIIHTAKPIIDGIIDMSDVRRVYFGRIRCLYGRGKLWMSARSKGPELILRVQDPHRMQTFYITARSEDQIWFIFDAIKGLAARHQIPMS